MCRAFYFNQPISNEKNYWRYIYNNNAKLYNQLILIC